MSFDTQQDRVNCILHGVQEPFWNDVLLPTLQDKCKQKLESLSEKSDASDDIKRGWVQALRWIINLPAAEVAIFQRLESERARDYEAEQRAEHRATFGLRGPIREAPGIGETKESETQTVS